MAGADGTIAERTDERLDRDSLESYLADCGFDGDLSVSQFPAGSSNLTYLIEIAPDEFVLRRPPFGNTVKSAHDMRREFGVLTKLSKVYSPAPKPILFCSDESVIGSEFYLMERRRGMVIRGTIDQGYLRKRVGSSSEIQAGMARSFIQNLVDLHSIDYKAAGLTDLGKPDGYCRRQVEGWTKRYFAAKTHEQPDLESAIEWLNESIPGEFGASIVHNDFKFDNVMLDPEDLTKITAVLDWEMVTVGDPLMDLGTTLGYWMSPDAGDEMLNMPFNPRILMENISRKDLVDMYAKAAGRDLPDMLFYYVFGTFKIAVICQQIYARYVKGFTKDKRFSNFDRFVASLGSIASSAIQKEQI
jgi:aminoglycoside phosphotransferase (APT) family kinase protein